MREISHCLKRLRQVDNMAMKFYAVRCGRQTGIFTSWSECQKNVTGYSGAEFKSFLTRSDAESFLMGADKSAGTAPRPDAAVAYVDGSYNIETHQFSFGMVIFYNGDMHEMNEAFSNTDLATMRNVAGEVKGAEAAMRYCVENAIPKLDIYYDYKGIEKWCTGDWKTTKPGTTKYKEYYNSVKDRLDVRFVKVKGHSGDKYNDRADALAKSALGIGDEQ